MFKRFVLPALVLVMATMSYTAQAQQVIYFPTANPAPESDPSYDPFYDVGAPAHDCACGDLDNGNEPASPGGAAVHCMANDYTVGYSNYTQPDRPAPNQPGYFQEFVCGNPAGSTPYLTNGGVVMMSSYILQCAGASGSAPAVNPPSWMGAFFGGTQFPYREGCVIPPVQPNLVVKPAVLGSTKPVSTKPAKTIMQK
jgi:hypothetical protein